MKALIIDKEILVASKLKKVAEKLNPDINFASTLTSAEKAYKYLSINHPDIIFIDVNIADENILKLFEIVPSTSLFVLIAENNSHSAKSIKSTSVCYLTKPFSSDSVKTILYLKGNLDISSLDKMRGELVDFFKRRAGYKKRFMIRIGSKIRKVEIFDIAYFYQVKSTVYCVTKQNKVYPLNFKIDDLNSLLNPIDFFRINKSMIVAFHAISKILPGLNSEISIELNPIEPDEVRANVDVKNNAQFIEWLNN